MKKDVSINDELKAIQSGEMPCHSRKTGYLYRLLQAASGDAPQVNGKPDCTGCLQGKSQTSIQKFTDFLTWAEAQKTPASAG